MARLHTPKDSLTRAASLGVAIVMISLLHYMVPVVQFHWHNALQHLYYLPVVIAALMFGWRGGLWAALAAAASHMPYVVTTWSMEPTYAMDQVQEMPFYCVAGVLAGIFSEREHKQKQDLERTTAQLAAVYRELQENFERMKRAERLYAVGQLSAGLAHEIRNPLASIAGAVGILERNSSSEQKRIECIQIVKKENQRLNQLLSSFLDFARPRPPKYLSTDVRTILDSVVDLAAHATAGKSIVFRNETAPGVSIECDPEQLKQVLLNLLINAIQAMKEGDIVLSARREHERVWIQVKDEGCGISAEARDRIFDPFFTTKESGTGLGLAVAHQIVEQHGGILTAENNAERGMTFSVQLPAHRERML